MMLIKVALIYAIFLTVLVAVIAVWEQSRGIESLTYLLLPVILILGIAYKNPHMISSKPAKRSVKLKSPLGEDMRIKARLREKDKRLLMFYILTLAEKREAVDMNELAQDLNVSIFLLSDIIKTMGEMGIVEVTYPPLKHFPIIRRGDRKKAREFREKIYYRMSKRTISGKPDLDGFAKEVGQYLLTMKRKR